VYALCSQYDVWIVEDDPYYYLQYHSSSSDTTTTDNAANGTSIIGTNATTAMKPALKSSIGKGVPGLHGLPRGASYLSMDVDGRVIRVDSFAKFFAPGARLGWVTARADVVRKLTSTIHSHTVGPCALSQAVVAATLATWGRPGLDAHLRTVQSAYKTRAAAAVGAAERHLAGLAEWRRPDSGMFLWLKLLWVDDATDVWEELREARVVLLPGRVTHCRGADPAFRSPCARLSYSSASEADLEEGIARLGGVLRARMAAVQAAAKAKVGA
jgi:kynurenine/2-aminoadipate aminotransferase